MNVAISKSEGAYPSIAPYHPDQKYPEYPLDNISEESNSVYHSVRSNFILLGYDENNIGKKEWNPLGHIVKPGDTVFIKPNLVDHKHRFDEDIWTVITHPSVIRVVADYVAIALKGKGKIIIGDNPHVDTNFEILREICHFDDLKIHYEKEFGIECEIVDLRFWQIENLKYYGFKQGRTVLSGDKNGFSKVNLGKRSLLRQIHSFLLRGTYNDRFETIRHHIFGRHNYFFSNSILSANVYISIPKLKSHAKVGATLNIKGLIGTIANKNCLVHWRIGFPKLGGDEYPNPLKKRDYFKLYFQHFLIDFIPEKIYFRLRNFFNKTKFGKWYNYIIDIESQKKRMLRGSSEGNDTIWRMTVDVFNVFVKDLTGFRKSKNWTYKGFSVVDGVVGGDTDGPHFPNKVNPGVIISGEDLLAVDSVAVRLMDFNRETIKYLDFVFKEYIQSENNIKVVSDDFDTKDFFNTTKTYLQFRPPYRWTSLSLKNLKPGKSFLPL